MKTFYEVWTVRYLFLSMALVSHTLCEEAHCLVENYTCDRFQIIETDMVLLSNLSFKVHCCLFFGDLSLHFCLWSANIEKISNLIFSSSAHKRLLCPCPHFLSLVSFSCWWWWWVAPMVVVVTLSQLTFKQVGAAADTLATDFLLFTKRGAPLFWALGHFSSSSQTSGVEPKDNWRLVWFIDGRIFPNLTGSLPLTTSKIASFNSSAHYKRFPNRTPRPPNQTTGVLAHINVAIKSTPKWQFWNTRYI